MNIQLPTQENAVCEPKNSIFYIQYHLLRFIVQCKYLSMSKAAETQLITLILFVNVE